MVSSGGGRDATQIGRHRCGDIGHSKLVPLLLPATSLMIKLLIETTSVIVAFPTRPTPERQAQTLVPGPY